MDGTGSGDDVAQGATLDGGAVGLVVGSLDRGAGRGDDGTVVTTTVPPATAAGGGRSST